MPKYKNRFDEPAFSEVSICHDTEGKIGTIRIKPVAVGWKPAGKGRFYTVSLEQFMEWITDAQTGARLTKS